MVDARHYSSRLGLDEGVCCRNTNRSGTYKPYTPIFNREHSQEYDEKDREFLFLAVYNIQINSSKSHNLAFSYLSASTRNLILPSLTRISVMDREKQLQTPSNPALGLTSPTRLDLGKASRVPTLAGSADRISRSPIRALRSPLKTLTATEQLRPGPVISPSRQLSLASPVRRSGSPERRQRILELEREGRPDKRPKTVTVNAEPQVLGESMKAGSSKAQLVVEVLKETNALLYEMKETQRQLVAEVKDLKETVRELKRRSDSR